MTLVAENQQLPIAAARSGKPEAWEVLFRRYNCQSTFSSSSWPATSKPAWISFRRPSLPPSAISPTSNPTRTSPAGSLASRASVASNAGESRTAKPVAAMNWPTRTLSSSPVRRLAHQREQGADLCGSWANFPCPNAPRFCCTLSRIFHSRKIARITDTSLGTVKSRIHYGNKPCESCYGRPRHENAA